MEKMGVYKLWCISGMMALATMTLASDVVAQEKACIRPADCLAQQLIKTIPAGEKIAVRPLLPKETGIPKKAGIKIYDDILNALFRASAGSHEIIGRNRIEEIWKIWEAQFIGDFAKLIEQSRASVEIVCKDAPHSKGIELSCNGIPIGKNRSLAVMAMGQQVFPRKQNRFEMEHGLASIARALAEDGIGTHRVGRVHIINESTGQQTDLTSYLGKRLKAAFNDRQGERRKLCKRESTAKAVLQSGDGKGCSAAIRYRLSGELWPLDPKTVEISLTLFEGEANKAEARVKMERGTLPQRFLKHVAVKRIFYNAVAEAVISPQLDRDSAERAARNLARARVVAQALQRRPPVVTRIENEADGVHVLGSSLNHAIPVDERFSIPRLDGNRLSIELQARVLRVGATLRPALTAHLENKLIFAKEPIRIMLAAEETVHVAIYSWGADNRVVRLYPNRHARDLVIRAGQPLTLPTKFAEVAIISEPLQIKGNIADQEAIIVLAAGKGQTYETLAPLAGDTLASTGKVALTGGQFFDRMAKLDLSRMTVIVLPYQVSKQAKPSRFR